MSEMDYTKIKLADGWYIVQNGAIINRSDNQAPIPIGSELVMIVDTPSVTVPLDKEKAVSLIHHTHILAWKEPDKNG